jgi:hypothetical protein
MKPFDLQKFLAGEPITTIGGHKILSFMYDTTNGDMFPIKVILIDSNGWRFIGQYNEKGHLLGSIDSNYFLCMKEPETWINLYYDQETAWLGVNRYKTEEEAKEDLTDKKWYQTSIKLKP